MTSRFMLLGVLATALAAAGACGRDTRQEPRPSADQEPSGGTLAPGKVLIVTDGSVRLFTHRSKLLKQGNQHRWNGAGANVKIRVFDCASEDEPAEQDFSRASLEIVSEGSVVATLTITSQQGTFTLDVADADTDTNRDYEIRGAGGLYRVEGPASDLRIGKVTINGTEVDPSGETCLTFD